MSSRPLVPRVRTSRRRPRHLEDAESVYLMQWAGRLRLDVLNRADVESGSTLSDYLFHIPNGGRRGALEAARLQSQGVKAGVSDYFLPLPVRSGVKRADGSIPVTGYAGLWVELKATGGRVSREQSNWLLRMHRAGYCAVLAFGWSEAARAVGDYLGLPSSCFPSK